MLGPQIILKKVSRRTKKRSQTSLQNLTSSVSVCCVIRLIAVTETLHNFECLMLNWRHIVRLLWYYVSRLCHFTNDTCSNVSFLVKQKKIQPVYFCGPHCSTHRIRLLNRITLLEVQTDSKQWHMQELDKWAKRNY